MRSSFPLATAAGIAVAALLVAAPAHAVSTAIYAAGPGLGLDIPDDDPNGISVTITATPGNTFMDPVPPGGATVLGVEVGVSIDHTFVGDLIITLEGPDGTIVTLTERPGEPDQGAFGDSANAVANLPLLFGDRSLWPAENMGLDCAGNDDVIGLDCIRAFAPDDSMEAFVLANINLLGDWTLTISDNAGADLGVLNGWYIELDFEAPIPVPAALWLFASALGIMTVARKRR